MTREYTLRMPDGEYVIAPAQPEDADTFLAILEEAAGWLTDRGIDQWQPGGFDRLLLEASITAGEAYVVRQDGMAAAVFSLQWADPATWGDQPDDAGYFHDFAVRRSFAGRRLGLALLRWAEGYIRATGRAYLRLDCVANNPILNDYYRRAGYEFQRQVGVRYPVCLYQRRVDPSP